MHCKVLLLVFCPIIIPLVMILAAAIAAFYMVRIICSDIAN